MRRAILSTTYFGPIQWYQKLCRFDEIVIERHESFLKQTYRNRCIISTTNGLQQLTLPVERPESGDLHHTPIGELRVSDHGNWRHIHWNALMSAYNESPFFMYYADDIRPFFEKEAYKPLDNLFDFNLACCRKVCDLLDIHPKISVSEEYLPAGKLPSSIVDLRNVINPKRPLPDPDFKSQRYYQVYESKFGFQPNLSILDLLFNMGPESIYLLIDNGKGLNYCKNIWSLQ